jgi:hypothetical protein
MKRPLLHKRKNRGFTLTELAIVLLGVSLVLGAVWVAGKRVWGNYQLYRTTQELLAVVQNIRDYYSNAQQLPNEGELTTQIDTLRLFPEEMRRGDPSTDYGNSAIDHPFNGTFNAPGPPNLGSFRVTGVEVGVLRSRFRVHLRGVSSQACQRIILNTVPLGDASIGVTGLCISQSAMPAPCYNSSVPNSGFSASHITINDQGRPIIGGVAVDLAASQVAVRCTGEANNLYDVYWEFRLRN